MKTILIFLFLVLFSCDRPTTIKSSDIKDAAITDYKLSGGEIGLILDQKTGDTVELMYKGKSFVPIKECKWQDVKIDRPVGTYLVWMRRCDFECKGCVNPGKDSVCAEHHWIMFYEGNGKWNTEPWEAPNNPVDYKVKILSWMILPPHK